jgi:hypothetical protein
MVRNGSFDPGQSSGGGGTELTQGKAAEVAGLSRAGFITELARYGVSPFQETASEILEATRDVPE